MQTLGSRLRAEGKKIGEKIGIEEGVKIGIQQEKYKTARELLIRGVDIDLILQVTGLSKGELDALCQTNHSPAANL